MFPLLITSYSWVRGSRAEVDRAVVSSRQWSGLVLLGLLTWLSYSWQKQLIGLRSGRLILLSILLLLILLGILLNITVLILLGILLNITSILSTQLVCQCVDMQTDLGPNS